MPTSTCLYTTIRNISAQTFFISCLGTHGISLAPNTDYQVFGTVWDYIRSGSRPNKRKQTSLENALINGLITITSSPSPVLYDAGSDDAKVLDLSSGTLGVADPCFGAYSGSP